MRTTMKKWFLTPLLLSTIVLAAGSAYATALYFPHVATSFPWQTEIAVINTGDQTVTGTLRGISNAGLLVETKPVTLSAHGRKQITVADEFTNHLEIGYIVFDTGSTSVHGYTKFYQAGTYRAAIPAVKEINTSDIYVSHVDAGAQWWTGVSLVNTTAATKTLTMTFNNGQTRIITLNANQHQAFLIDPQPDIRSAVITNASGVIGLELFGNIGGSDHLEGILLTDKTASTLYYPHVAGDGWWTGIVAYNPSALACTITITPYSALGNALTPSTRTIAGKGKYVGLVSDLALPAQTAWFRIDSTSPLSGFELFSTADGNQLAAYAGGGGTGAKSGVFAKIEKNGGWTGIAFVNTEESAASVTLTAYNDNGTVVATRVLPVGGHAKWVDLAEAIFTQNIGGATYIAYSSDRNVVGFQLNSSFDWTMLDGLPALGGSGQTGGSDQAIVNGDFSSGMTGWQVNMCRPDLSTVGIITDQQKTSNVMQVKKSNSTGYGCGGGAYQTISYNFDNVISIVLKADVKVVTQSLYAGGSNGGEYPAGLYIGDQPVTKWFWTHDFYSIAGNAAPSTSTQIPQNQWFSYTSPDLKQYIPAGTQQINLYLYSAGWDFEAHYDNVSLIITTKDGMSPDISQGLVAYYPLNGNANDQSGNNHSGVKYGNTSFVTGVVGQGALFDGSGDVIQVNPNYNSDLTGSPFTFATWVKVTSFPYFSGSENAPFIDSDVHQLPNRFLAYKATNGTLGIMYQAATGVNLLTVVLIENLSLNQWYHLSATADSSKLRLYLNGVLVNEAAFNCTQIYTWNGSVKLGGNDRYGRYMTGYLDEVRVYKRALTQTDIKALYDQDTITNDSTADVTGYWVGYKTPQGQPASSYPTYFQVSQSGGNISILEPCRNLINNGSGTINGTNISITYDGVTYTGIVNGNSISGNYADSGGNGTWAATKMSAAPTDKECVVSTAETFGVYFSNNQNYVASYFYDRNAVVSSATLTGYNIITPVPYIYNLYPSRQKEWWINENVFISTGVRPSSPLPYSAHINFKDGTSQVISGYVTTWEPVQ